MVELIRTGNRNLASVISLAALAVAVLIISACSSSAASPIAPLATRTPEPDPGTATGLEQFASVPGIVDPANFGWPREVETGTGRIEIPAAPTRIYSLSLGHAEIVAALRGGEVLVASASFFKDPGTSAAYSEYAGLPDVGSEPEEIISLDPEIVIASAFTSADLIAELTGVGIQIVRANLEDSALGNVPNILLLGYMLGAEQRAVELAGEVTSRVNAISDRVSSGNPERPRVLAMSRFTDIYAAGDGSTEGGIIEAAGAINVAVEGGITGHQQIGIEGIAAMNPDIILLTQPEQTALELADELYADPALAEVPAIRDRRVLPADPTFYTTLSHWNVRGIEESARVFYPELFSGVSFAPFTHP